VAVGQVHTLLGAMHARHLACHTLGFCFFSCVRAHACRACVASVPLHGQLQLHKRWVCCHLFPLKRTGLGLAQAQLAAVHLCMMRSMWFSVLNYGSVTHCARWKVGIVHSMAMQAAVELTVSTCMLWLSSIRPAACGLISYCCGW
jgi:hypothetical protein